MRSVDDAERWALSSAGLALFLNALRARVALSIVASGGTLVALATGVAGWPRLAAPVIAVVAAALGATMIVGLVRHLRHAQAGAGGVSGALAALVLALALALDALALIHALALAAPPAELAALSPLSVALLAELVAFVALAPVALAAARLAGALGARDVRRRGYGAALLVASTALGLGALAHGFERLPPHLAIALGSVAAASIVLSLAKLLGATRFLLAYTRALQGPTSRPSGLELEAWHRA